MKASRPKKIRSLSLQTYFPWIVSISLLFLFLIVLGGRYNGDSTQVNASNASKTVMIAVDVPSRPVKKGEQLSQVPFSRIEWPASSSPDNSFITSVAHYKNYYAATNLAAFSPITVSSLNDTPIDANAVVGGIPVGFRAITVKVDVESAVEGWAQTGNFVDVILLRKSDENDMGIEAKVIAENVKILSTGSSTEKSTKRTRAAATPPTVTLLVSQEDALKVRTASTIGRLSFALRGIGDESPALALHMNQKNLLGGSRTLRMKKNKNRFKGTAKAPDGSVYVLDEDSRWILEKKINDTSTEAVTE